MSAIPPSLLLQNPHLGIESSGRLIGEGMSGKLTRRDLLAQERTHLANERTLLAYWRTALALSVLGAFLLKFTDHYWFYGLAAVAISLAVVLSVFGILRFRQNRARISRY